MNFKAWCILLAYVAAVSLVTFLAFGLDKWKARNARWRVPESTLMWMAFAGGAVGALIGMKVWHHKTKHRKFSIGVPAILVLHVVLLLVAVYSMARL